MRYPPGRYYYLSFNNDFLYIASVVIDENTREGEDGTLYFATKDVIAALGEYARYGNGRSDVSINKYHNIHPSLDSLLDEPDPKTAQKVRVEIFEKLFTEFTRWDR